MTISRVKPSSWAVNDVLTSAQINALDVTLTTALDKTSAGDTLSGAIALSGAGRVIPSVTLGSDANSTITVGGGNTVLRITSAVTANRDYTLSATGAATNDVITIYAESSFAFTITVKDQASATMFTIGNNDSDDGPWCSFIYVGGWRKFQTSQGSRLRQVTYTSGSGSFTVPAGVTSLLLIGWGGGGGGGGGNDGDTSTLTFARGGGGGAGALQGVVRVSVTPGVSYLYEVGAGGAGGGTSPPTAGSAGGDTFFDNTFFFGGDGGLPLTSYAGDAAGALGGQPGGNNGVLYINGFETYLTSPQSGGASGASFDGKDGGYSSQFQGGGGGSKGALSGSYRGGGGGGGGGAGPGGAGGNGGAGSDADATTALGAVAGATAAANSGAGGGGGGGGGGASVLPGAGGAGGAGGSGQLTIIWVK